MSFKDKHIPCKDCGGEFVFTAGEQEFYAQKGFTNEPTRCPAGRRARKEGRNLTDITGGRVCPHDVSGNGSITDEAIEASGASRPRRSDDWSRSYDRPRGESRGWSGERSRRDREPYTGPLPSGPVNATIVRIDPAGRFLLRASIIRSSMCMSTDRSSARCGGRSRRAIRSQSLSRRVIAVHVRERSICGNCGETCGVE